jgi:hypothetical protein
MVVRPIAKVSSAKTNATVGCFTPVLSYGLYLHPTHAAVVIYIKKNMQLQTENIFAALSLFSSSPTQKANPKSATVPVTSNLAAHAWSTKCRRKKKINYTV